MAIMKRFGVALLVVAAALPFAAAQPGHDGQSSCKNSHFWWACSFQYRQLLANVDDIQVWREEHLSS